MGEIASVHGFTYITMYSLDMSNCGYTPLTFSLWLHTTHSCTSPSSCHFFWSLASSMLEGFARDGGCGTPPVMAGRFTLHSHSLLIIPGGFLPSSMLESYGRDGGWENGTGYDGPRITHSQSLDVWCDVMTHE